MSTLFLQVKLMFMQQAYSYHTSMHASLVRCLYNSCGCIVEKMLSMKLDEAQNAIIGIPSKSFWMHSIVLGHSTLSQLTGEEGVLQIVPTTFPST